MPEKQPELNSLGPRHILREPVSGKRTFWEPLLPVALKAEKMPVQKRNKVKLTLKNPELESRDNSLSILLNKYLKNPPSVGIVSLGSSFTWVKETIILDSKKGFWLVFFLFFFFLAIIDQFPYAMQNTRSSETLCHYS